MMEIMVFLVVAIMVCGPALAVILHDGEERIDYKSLLHEIRYGK